MASVGASPGASTAVPIMLDILQRCFPDRMGAWLPQIKLMVPSYGTKLSDEPVLADKTLAATARVLEIVE